MVITICGRLPYLGMRSRPDEQVEELVGAAELDVALERDRVVGLEQRVEELVLVDGPLLVEALREVVALEHARDGVFAMSSTISTGVMRVEPLGVVADLDPPLVEDT